MGSDGKRRCPSCGGRDIRHSVRSGLLDAIMEMFHRRPYRCRNCRRRFYSYRKDPLPVNTEQVSEGIDHHID